MKCPLGGRQGRNNGADRHQRAAAALTESPGKPRPQGITGPSARDTETQFAPARSDLASLTARKRKRVSSDTPRRRGATISLSACAEIFWIVSRVSGDLGAFPFIIMKEMIVIQFILAACLGFSTAATAQSLSSSAASSAANHARSALHPRAFENQNFTMALLPGWTVALTDQQAPEKTGDFCVVDFIYGNYLLSINPVFTHASGVTGGRMNEILRSQPSVVAVSRSRRSCWRSGCRRFVGFGSRVPWPEPPGRSRSK